MPSDATVLEIPLSKLYPDCLNPRLGSHAPDRRSAYEGVIRRQGKKIVTLATDIVEQQGVSRADLPMVIPDEHNDYIVVDGNRRLTALMLLQTPENADGILDPSDVQRLRELKKRYAPPVSIHCAVYPTRADANSWIQRRHTGERGGAGPVDWGPMEQARWNEQDGVPDPTLAVLDFVWQHASLSQDDRDVFWSIRFTNLKRLIQDQNSRKTLGINLRLGKVYTELARDQVLPGLRRLVLLVLDPDLTETHIDNAGLMANQLMKFAPEDLPHSRAPRGPEVLLRDAPATHGPVPSEPPAGDSRPSDTPPNGSGGGSPTPPGSGPGHGPGGATPPGGGDSPPGGTGRAPDPPGKTSGEGKSGGKGGRPKKSEEDREVLIPKRVRLDVDHPRAQRIYNELKDLNVDRYPNASAALFRIFFEMSVESYIANQGVAVQPGDKTLAKRTRRLREHLDQAGRLDEKASMAVQGVVDNEQLLPEHIANLNAYVHGLNSIPTPQELKVGWTRVEPFVSVLWPQPKP